MIAAFAADQHVALAFTTGAVIGQCDFQRGIDTLRTGVAVEDVVEVTGRQCGQALGDAESIRVAELEGRAVIHRRHLFLHSLDDFRPAMPGIDAPQSGRAVEHLPAIVGGVVHVLRGDQHARRLFEGTVGSEGHPE